MERTDELKERIRQQPLNDRLEESRRRIGDMCSQGRCPKMTIPVQHDDDDFYINTTLADAQATIAALQEKLTAALKVKADYDRWLSGGVYFTTAEYEKHAEEHRQREAALQARVKELEEWVQDQSTANLETMRHVDEMQSRAMDAESQLTQRTAERDTARRRVDELETREVDVVLLRDDLEQRTAECDALKLVNDTHMKTVMKLSHIVEQQTAELEAVKADTKNMLDVATRRLHEQVNDLQAELDRVRGLIVEYAKAKTDFDETRLQEDHYAGKERYSRLVEAENALLQHRQGMEG